GPGAAAGRGAVWLWRRLRPVRVSFMHWTDRLGMAQRVVVVVALGFALAIAAGYVTSLGTRSGWYAYAPLSGQAFTPGGTGEPGWVRMIIWLVAIGLWAVVSVRVLRQTADLRGPE